MTDSPSESSGPPTDELLSRRSFVIRAIAALGALAIAAVGIPAAAFVTAPGWLSDAQRRLLSHTLSPALRSDEWTSGGPIDAFRIGQPKRLVVDRPIVDGWVERVAPVGVYVLRESDSRATVFDPHCTHLGCPVEYSSGSGSFLCPCAGAASQLRPREQCMLEAGPQIIPGSSRQHSTARSPTGWAPAP